MTVTLLLLLLLFRLDLLHVVVVMIVMMMMMMVVMVLSIATASFKHTWPMDPFFTSHSTLPPDDCRSIDRSNQ